MSSENLVRLADSCSALRRSIGRVLLSPERSEERAANEEEYRRALRDHLRIVRDEECALFLEAAGELAG